MYFCIYINTGFKGVIMDIEQIERIVKDALEQAVQEM